MHHETGIKIVRRKTGFFEIHLRKQNLINYLKIGFLGIKCKNENFQKLNLKENWDFEESHASLNKD